MAKIVEGVAYDLEGDVVDTEFIHHGGHLYSASQAGLQLTIPQAIKVIPHFIGGPDNAIAEEISALSGGKRSPAEIADDKKSYYDEQLAKLTKIEPRPGFLRFLEYVKNRGIPVAIGSLTVREQALVLLQASGLDRLFPADHIVLRDGVREVKPSPEVWLKTAFLMGIDPARQIVFDDSPNGILAAVRAESRAYGMPVYYQMREVKTALRKAGTTRIFRSWNEVYRIRARIIG